MVLDLNKAFALFLTLAGLSGTSCVIGCSGSGDGGALTVNDILDAADRTEAEYEIEGEMVGPAEAGMKNTAILEPGWRGRFSLKGKGNPNRVQVEAPSNR